MPCWADLALAGDTDAVTAFYGAVLGWTFTDDGAAEHHEAVALAGERRVAGLGAPDGSPPGWTLYLGVEDAADVAERLEEAGGMLLHGPDDDGCGGLVVVALDAGGATVGLWESDAPGAAPAWVEAASADPGLTKTFYGTVLGLTHEPTDEPGTTTLHRDGPALGAVVFAGDALPHWLVHFGVSDVDDAVAAAGSSGGLVLEGPGEGLGGRRTVLADPSGARFAVITRT
ncbi:VOC family protein [Actinomycetospora endophytica]|uniref:VOC family protein n=1 Tax=Actinomycetospora endophytica TaxID=2291215 RepID=A0ABS8PGK6_9PSEU|nr:VOC family protein [Actinomycetospora endophytica]MCD2197393.1 VOC family protein [Actinomycetospora endophytica]